MCVRIEFIYIRQAFYVLYVVLKAFFLKDIYICNII